MMKPRPATRWWYMGQLLSSEPPLVSIDIPTATSRSGAGREPPKEAVPRILPKTTIEQWEPHEVLLREPGTEWRLTEWVERPIRTVSDHDNALFVLEHVARTSIIGAAEAVVRARSLAKLFLPPSEAPGRSFWQTFYGTTNNRFSGALVLDFPAAGPLSQHLSGSGMLSIPRIQYREAVAKFLVTEILHALRWLHNTKRFTWCTPGLQNVYLDRRGHVQLRLMLPVQTGGRVPFCMLLPKVNWEWLPPEVLAECHVRDGTMFYGSLPASPRWDMFGVAIMAARLVTGTGPFGAKNVAERSRHSVAMSRSGGGAVTPKWASWVLGKSLKGLSPEFRDFVMQLANPLPGSRANIDQALNHMWIHSSPEYEAAIATKSVPSPFQVRRVHPWDTRGYPRDLRRERNLLRGKLPYLTLREHDAKVLQHVQRRVCIKLLRNGGNLEAMTPSVVGDPLPGEAAPTAPKPQKINPFSAQVSQWARMIQSSHDTSSQSLLEESHPSTTALVDREFNSWAPKPSHS
jgi:serine/threonine protein kinase